MKPRGRIAAAAMERRGMKIISGVIRKMTVFIRQRRYFYDSENISM
jgi:hypothetical protein